MNGSISRKIAVVGAMAILAAALASQAWCAVLPDHEFTASEGWYNGDTVYYLMTGVSNSTYATSWSVPYTPLLANALVIGSLPSLFFVTNNSQGLVFTTQWNARYVSTSYIPIWVLWTVTWNTGSTPVELESYADIKAAKVAGDVTVRRQNIAVGASIIINSLGIAQEQATVTTPDPPHKHVALPQYEVYIGGVLYYYVALEFQRRNEAMAFGATYAANLSKFSTLRRAGVPKPYEPFLNIWSRSAPGQPPIAIGLTPLRNEWIVSPHSTPSVIFTSYEQLTNAGIPNYPTTYFAYLPVTGPAPP